METEVAGKLLTLKQAAATLGISVRKLHRLLTDKSLPGVRVGARGTRIKESALAAFVNHLPDAR